MRQKIISETMDNMEMVLGDIDVVILCGGRGERLSSVLPDRPKVLATIGEQTLLDILIDDITRFGFKRIILSVGYLKEQIIDHFKYEQRFNMSAAPSAAYAYDAVNLVADALKSGSEIANYLEAIKDYPGISNTITFENGRVTTKNHIIKNIRNNSFKKLEK